MGGTDDEKHVPAGLRGFLKHMEKKGVEEPMLPKGNSMD
jgi:hypothetical protein